MDRDRCVCYRRLDQPERCTAKSKTSVDQCRQLAIAGGRVCVYHGGKIPLVAASASIEAEKTTERARHPERSDQEIVANLVHTHDWLFTRAQAAYDADDSEENRLRLHDESFKLQRLLFAVKTKTDYLSLTDAQFGAIADIRLREVEARVAEQRASVAALPPSTWVMAEPQGILMGQLPAAPPVIEGEVQP